jgi:Sec-independent protein translocase protein TatA
MGDGRSDLAIGGMGSSITILKKASQKEKKERKAKTENEKEHTKKKKNKTLSLFFFKTSVVGNFGQST